VKRMPHPTPQAFDLLVRVEHTELRPSATYADIRRVCLEAMHYGFGAVVVHPVHCARAARWLRPSSVRVVAVVGFPSGAFCLDGKATEAHDAIDRGAAEIDYVVNIGALRGGDHSLLAREMDALRAATRGCTVKAILEASMLTDADTRCASKMAYEAGIDFVGTATGFTPSGSVAEDVRLLREAVGGHVAVKASGDIRTVAQARELLDAGAARLGTTMGVRIATELAGDEEDLL